MLTNRAGMDNSAPSLANAIERLRSLRWLGLPAQAIAIRGRSSAPSRADHFARCASSADRGIGLLLGVGSAAPARWEGPNGTIETVWCAPPAASSWLCLELSH